MTQEQFLYWLQGFAELSATPPTAEQWKSIREHLALCFKKVTPPVQTGLEKGAPDPMAGKSVEDFRRAMEDLRKQAVQHCRHLIARASPTGPISTE